MTDVAKNYLDRYHRRWYGPLALTVEEIASVPAAMKGVYQILVPVKGQQIVAYIGIATGETVRGRLRAHLAGRGNWAVGRIERPQDLLFVYFECATLEAKQIESHVISDAKPAFNVRPEYRNYIENITVH